MIDILTELLKLEEVSDEQLEQIADPLQLIKYINDPSFMNISPDTSHVYQNRAMEYFVYLCRKAEPMEMDLYKRFKELMKANSAYLASGIQKGDGRFANSIRMASEKRSHDFLENIKKRYPDRPVEMVKHPESLFNWRSTRSH